MRHLALITCLLVLSFTLLVLSDVGVSNADDAAVLPKGKWRLQVDTNYFLPITKRYNKNGDVEDAAKDFNTNLTNQLLGLQAICSPVNGACTPTDTLGRSLVTFRYDIKYVNTQVAYGLTDRLSLGTNIPYWFQTTNVTANVDSSTATLCRGAGSLIPIAKCGGAFTTPISANDVQALLVLKSFKKVETWSDDHLADMEVGGKYQYYKAENFRAAFTGGVRLPTGELRDPANLVARNFGREAWALLFRFHQDLVLNQKSGVTKDLGIPEPGSILFNTTFRYDWNLPDKADLQVCDVNNPLCSGRDTNVHRKVGDVVEGEISAKYGLPKNFSLAGLYKYGHKFKDHYGGDKALTYGLLSNQSNYNEHIYIFSIGYDTIPLYAEGSFPVPMQVLISYRNRFDGDNNQLVGQYIGLTLSVYF
jgi:hypothetical protein